MEKQRPIPEPKRLKDGFLDSLGGVNQDPDPYLLQITQLARAENITLRGGFPTTRPGFIPRPLTFANQGLSAWWATKVFQGSKTYESVVGDNYKLVMVGGRLFKEDPAAGYFVTEITPQQHTKTVGDQISPAIGASVAWLAVDASDVLIGLPVTIGDGDYMVTTKLNNLLTLQNLDATPGVAVPAETPIIYLQPNPSTRPVAWFEQAEEFMVVQDGQSPAIIWDGSSARRAMANEVPVGTVMQYNRNRLWVAYNTNLVVAGDIAEIGNNANLLRFTEYLVIQGGGSIRVEGEITAMVTMPALDASLGQGPLQIITENGFTSIDLPTQRDLWGSAQFQTVSLKNSGALGQYSVVVINSDPWYRSLDGMRSFVSARREFGGWSNTPQSAEMRKTFDEDAQDLLKYCSAVLFDNRLLVTFGPRRLSFNAYWSGMVSLDFNALSSMSSKSNPIYEDVWTGIHPYQLLTGKFLGQQRCYAFTNEPTGIGLWEISKDEPFDGDGGRISSWVEYPKMKFATPMLRKKLQSLKAWFADLLGDVDVTLKWRPDDVPCWLLWKSKQVCAKAKVCATDSCEMGTLQAGYKPHMGFGQPPDTCDPFSGNNARFGYCFQPRLEWVGHATIKRVLSTADEFDEQTIGVEDADQ